MLAPAEMAEVDIFVLENDIQQVAQVIASMGLMHLLDVNSLSQWEQGAGTAWQGRIATYTTQERRIVDLMHSLEIPEQLRPCEGQLNPEQDHVLVEKELSEIELRANELQDRARELERTTEKLELSTRSLQLLAPLSISIEDLEQLKHLHFVAGMLPAENLSRLETSLYSIPYRIMPVEQVGARELVFAFCAPEHAPILDRALESAFLDRFELPENAQGTASEALVSVRERLAKTKDELADIHDSLQDLMVEVRPILDQMLARVRDDHAIAEAMSHFGHRGRVYLVAGWVPTKRIEELQKHLKEATSDRITIEINSPYAGGKGQIVPTMLHNKLFKPFESLVNIYGTPGYDEIDPTPIVAVTFTLMFGAMFGDLGHGALLAITGLLLTLGIIGSASNLKKIGPILLGCGVFSMIFGTLYGSVFGMEDVIGAIWLRPMDDIMTLLEASVIFGVVVLNIGYICHIYGSAHRKRLKQAIFDRNGISGFVLYWSLLATVILPLTGYNLPIIFVLLDIVLSIALFFAEPLTKLINKEKPLIEGSLVEYLVQAFFELFETFISFLSNTLSFVRLGAFAVAHVGLSMVVFLLADMIGGPSFLGQVLRMVIIIGGNLFVIGFEGVIVGIQTLRLEYYEFFGKFFSGSGTPFKPLVFPDSQNQPAE